MLIKTRLKPIVGFILFFISLSGFAQIIIPRFEHLSVNDGLPHSSVYSIIQDKRGFMWFGTPDGLCRYDGTALLGFKYNAVDANDIINNFVRGKMFEDKKGSIWYCNESGIYKWDAFKEQVLKIRSFKQKEFDNSAFQAVAFDENGSLWLFNVLFGIFKFDIGSGELIRYPLPARFDYSTVILAYNTSDESGNIWLRIVSKNDPFIVFNKAAHTYTVQLNNDPPHAIFFGKEKKVQAFDNRLVYENLKTGISHTVLKQINNKKINFYSFDGIRDNYGRLWMTARGNGLFYYDEINNRFQEYHHDNSKIKSLPFDLTTCLFIDRSQNLWIGIDGGGVAKLDLKQPKFNLFPLSEGDYPMLSDYFTKCFYEDEEGKVWFGSHNNGLSILDIKTNELINYHHEKNNPRSIPGNIVGGILKDRDGNMWIGSSGGISLFDKKNASFKTIPIKNLPKLRPEMNIFVYKITQLKNGDILAATLSGLVKITKKQNGTYDGYYFSDKPYLISQTTDVVEVANGKIYLTVPSFGLYELKPFGNSYSLSNIFFNGIDLRSVRIDETNADWLWICSGTGLIHFNTATKKHELWNQKSGLANAYIYGSLEDEKHNLWMSTNGGLSYLNRATNHIDNYSFQDGLQSNEFNTQAFYKSSTNNFYFGGIKGFNWFQSKNFINEEHKPQVAITQIEVENSLLARNDNLSYSYRNLPYDSNDVNFRFAALDYTRPEANSIQYMLEGWDADWITTNTRSARYSNLPPGAYNMIVKAANADGVWSDEERAVLVIRSPFWKTGWFYLLAAIVIVGIIILVTKTITGRKLKKEIEKLERQKALEEERNRISQDMHDEIGSGITHIALLSELIQSKQENTPGLNKEIRIIAKSARKLVQTMSDIIWSLNPQNDSLENLLAYTREQSQQYFDSMDVDFSISFPETVPAITLSNEQRRNLYLVTREALNNAMKHSGAANIQLKLEITDDTCCFSVTDDGKGIGKSENKPGHNGLYNMTKRMEDVGGNIEWLSTEKGTSVKYGLSL